MKEITRLICCVLYYGFAQWLPASYMPGGGVWKGIRAFLCRGMFASCGNNVNIECRAAFHSGRKISIGNNSGIGLRADLSGTVIIGNDVMMGADCLIINRNHRFDRTDVPMRAQGFSAEQTVTIGDDVWIGARVTFLPGITVGRGAIIGVGAIVTKSVLEYAIVGGNPATVIRMRK